MKAGRTPRMTTRSRLRAKRRYRRLGRTKAERRAALASIMSRFFAAWSDRIAWDILALDRPPTT